jgi:hypothetical protein
MQYSEKLLDCELFVIITKSKFSTKQKQCNSQLLQFYLSMHIEQIEISHTQNQQQENNIIPTSVAKKIDHPLTTQRGDLENISYDAIQDLIELSIPY